MEHALNLQHFFSTFLRVRSQEEIFMESFYAEKYEKQNKFSNVQYCSKLNLLFCDFGMR